ncbi:hypothetical protein Phi13:2_gp045 [Cellulophaga phage phi13:2]|uniref:Uncharacterized protein n=1 Tax=Cellulophaga phage phi13:2 TaxID=1328030 RepID=S0A4F0_9CAUD|nr:hypothetical protein Phi13:2_gp045 [Cellulophaga phage phi13:2]AGO49655.1 hypothetical protein Phi13:2_gp045 [Cellulophaga phage phi13:2]
MKNQKNKDMIQKINEYNKKHVENKGQYVVKFDRPETLKDPMPEFYNDLYNLKDKIGLDKMVENMQIFCKGWALKNEYFLEIDEEKKYLIFTHVSILN